MQNFIIPGYFQFYVLCVCFFCMYSFYRKTRNSLKNPHTINLFSCSTDCLKNPFYNSVITEWIKLDHVIKNSAFDDDAFSNVLLTRNQI